MFDAKLVIVVVVGVIVCKYIAVFCEGKINKQTQIIHQKLTSQPSLDPCEIRFKLFVQFQSKMAQKASWQYSTSLFLPFTKFE